MIKTRSCLSASAFVALAAALGASFGGAPAVAQSPAALAEAAAKAAGRAPIDTLVTPDALRALRRLTDSAQTATNTPARRAPSRANTRPTPTRQSPPARTAPASHAADQQHGPHTVTDIVVREHADRRELRIVGSTPLVTTLSEPFRATDRTRLFLTLDSASITEQATGDAADITKDDAIAAVIPAHRDDGLRITVELTTLGSYGLETAGDTTILWFGLAVTEAHDASAALDEGLAGESAASTEAGGFADADPVPPPPAPSAGEIASAGWAAFRKDVATVAGAAGAFVVRAGDALLDFASHAGKGTYATGARAWSWLAASNVLVEAIRVLLLATLFLAPPAAVFLFFRRRRASSDAPAAQHTRASKPAKRAKAPKLPKSARPKVTRKTEDARLWAARTLAANGTDAAEIARQTGISRDAALLLVRRTRPRDDS